MKPERTYTRDGFELAVYHRTDDQDFSDHLGTFADGRAPLTFPAWDRCKKRVLWSEAEAAHHRAENDRWNGREYRYVHRFQDVEGVTRAEAEKYIRQNVKRLEDYGHGWGYLGVEVTAARGGVVLGRNSVWGVESDSDDAHFAELADECAEEAIAEARKKLAELAAPGKVKAVLAYMVALADRWENDDDAMEASDFLEVFEAGVPALREALAAVGGAVPGATAPAPVVDVRATMAEQLREWARLLDGGQISGATYVYDLNVPIGIRNGMREVAADLERGE